LTGPFISDTNQADSLTDFPEHRVPTEGLAERPRAENGKRCFMNMSLVWPQTKASWYCLVVTAAVLLGPVVPLPAAPPQLLSAHSPAVAPLPGGNGDSVTPRVSDNGRYVVFSSAATDLTTNANGQFYLNVYLRDRSWNTTLLISSSTNGRGGNGDSLFGQVSANDRYVVFQSDASDLMAGDTNGVTDIFLRDTFTGATRLISVAANGGFANGASTEPVMTPDGTCVAFISAATNLVAGDNNGIPDVFVRDLITQTTWLLSVGAVGTNSTMDTPVITPDGRFVAYFSSATNLVPEVPAQSLGEIYVRDRLAGTTIWASTNAALTCSNLLGTSPNNSWFLMPSIHPVISDDGRYVAFKTGWTNGIVTPPAGKPAVIFFQYDLVNRTTTIVSTNGYPSWANCDDVYGPEMTPDGRFIAYVEYNIVGGKTNSSVRLWDRLADTNGLVNLDTSGLWASNNISHTPAVSDDGRYVTFLSDATNLVSNTVSNGLHIYRRDLQTATTVLLDADTNGIGSADQLGTIPSLSADGQCAAFSALDGGLIGSDNNNAPDVFLWDATTGTNKLISARDPSALSQSGNGVSSLGQLSLSTNGGLVAFASYASDLVTNDFNGAADVFVRNLTTSTNPMVMVSVGLDGKSGSGGASYNPVISANGRYVAFASSATNIVAGNTNRAYKIFRRDLLAGTTELVNINIGNVYSNYDAFLPVSSQDGRYIAFLGRTNSLSLLGVLTNIFWQDMKSNLTLAVPGSAHPTRTISMSADGQRVAWFDSSARLYVWDANLQANIYTNTTAAFTSAAISPAGNRLLYQATNQLFVYDLMGNSNLFLCPSTVQIKGPSQWSGDGRYVAFVTATNLVAGDNNGTNDVYVLDLQTGALTLVSLNQSGTGSAAGVSDSPVVSTDGRLVVFRSFATNVLPGIVRPPSLFVYNRLSGSNSLLVTGSTGTGWTSWVSQPALSTDGVRLAYQSWDASLVGGDLNGAGDVFASTNFPALDNDGDGIPDWWMIQYFGHATGQAGDLSRSQDDADHDGVRNIQEFFAGTIPTNPSSILVVRIAPGISGADAVLNWEAAPGRTYQILSTTNLSDAVWPVFPGSIGVNGSQRYFNVPTADAQCFFRIQCSN
jgi:hypothetical protein